MLTNLPTAKLKSSLKKRLDDSSISKMHAMAWLNYEMFLQRLAKMSAENAKEDKSAVIREEHVKAAVKVILGSSKG